MIPTDRLRQMASKHWGADALTEYHWEKAIEYARLVEAEAERLLKVESRRMDCLPRGHEFQIKGTTGGIEGTSTTITFLGWKAYGECRNCDAVLVVKYKEEM